IEGETVTWTVSLANAGPYAATAVEVQVNVPSGLAVVSGTPTLGSYDTGTGLWTISNLESNTIDFSGTTSTGTLSLVTYPEDGTAGTSLNLTVDASAHEGDPSNGNNTAATQVSVTSPLAAEERSQSPSPLQPGASAVEMYRFALVNNSPRISKTISDISFEDASSGPGTATELAQNWGEVTLWLERSNIAPELLASLNDGTFSFSSLSIDLGALERAEVYVTSSASLTARDGDLLDLSVQDGGVVAVGGAEVTGTWPLDPNGSFAVDGMVLAQLSLHSLATAQAIIEEQDVLALDFTIPQNGYQSDAIELLRVANKGTIDTETGLDGVTFWVDGGNGAFDGATGDDTLLGDGSYASGLWVLAGLNASVVNGQRVFVSVDISSSASLGETIDLYLPDTPLLGIGMASGNDGPLDGPLENLAPILLVEDPDATVNVSANTIPGIELIPGGDPQDILAFSVENGMQSPITLDAMTLTNLSIGTGTEDQLDQSWTGLSVEITTTGGATKPQSESAAAQSVVPFSFVGGEAVLTGLGTTIPSGESVQVLVRGSASVSAKDGDGMDIAITDPSNLVFDQTLPLTVTWPLNSPGTHTNNGMGVAQVANGVLGSGEIQAGETDRLVGDFILPPNGYETDILRTIRFTNLGDATDSDIETLKLWLDTGNDVFDGSDTDALLGVGSYTGTEWLFDGLSEVVPLTGLHLFVTADAHVDAVAGSTLQLNIAGGAITMDSGNDGPVDGAVPSDAEFTIIGNTTGIVSVSGRQDETSLLPGGDSEVVFELTLENESSENRTLQSLTFTDVSQALGSQDKLDASWSTIELTLADGTPVTSSSMANGTVLFDSLNLDVPPQNALSLHLRAGATLVSRDGDRLDLRLSGPGSITFGEMTTVTGAWPLDPSPSFPVDGMAKAQVKVEALESATLAAGTEHNLVMDFTVPANGYATDRLNRVDVLNLGTANAGTDILYFELWVDDGDQSFNPESDLSLGNLIYTGARWEITALNLLVPLEGKQCYFTVTVSEFAEEGTTIRLAFPSEPDVAFGMASGNDGPRDGSIETDALFTITSTDRVTISSARLASGITHPGSKNVPLSMIRLTNTYLEDRNLNQISYKNTSQISDTFQRDGSFETLFLYEDTNQNGLLDLEGEDSILGVASFLGDDALFAGFESLIPAGETRSYFLVGEVALRGAADGDLLSVQIENRLSVGFLETTVVSAQWPMSSGAVWTVDGMVAEQVSNVGAPGRTLGQNSEPVAALDLVLPANGYEADVLTGFSVKNAGSAGPSDLAELRLWTDGGNGDFDAGEEDDQDLGQLFWNGESWLVAGLNQSIPAEGQRVFVSIQTANVLADSASTQLFVPMDGIVVASQNDGPIDGPVTNEETIWLSNSPLLASLRVEPEATTIGQTIQVVMEVENQGDETVTDITPSTLAIQGESSLNLLSGPSVSGFTLASGEIETITWVFETAMAGERKLVGDVTGNLLGSPIQSLQAVSNSQRTFVEASDLELFPKAAPPFTVSLGQESVSPLGFTFRNPGEVNGSDVWVNGMTLRLIDESDQGIVPADLLKGISLREGNRVYASKTNLETVGDEVVLNFTTPVIVTTAEPVTINLFIDIADETAESLFRVVVQSQADIEASDATSGAPVELALQGDSYPIRSELGNVTTAATQVLVSASASEVIRVGTGAADLTLLETALTNDGVSGITSDVWLTNMTVRLLDETGTPILTPGTHLKSLRLETPTGSVASLEIVEETSSWMVLTLPIPLTLAADQAMNVELVAEIREDCPVGTLQMELFETLELWDAISRDPVPSVHSPGTILGHQIRVEGIAEALGVTSTGVLPEAITVGSQNIEALELELRHPGASNQGRISVESLAFELRDEARAALPPGIYLDAVRVFKDGIEIGVNADLPNDGAMFVAIEEQVLEPSESVDLTIKLDTETSAPTSMIELILNADGLLVVDVNQSIEVEVRGENGTAFPVSSGLARLDPPARELLAALESRVPVNVVPGEANLIAASLVLTNPTTEGSGVVQVERLGFRLENAQKEAIAAGDVLQSLRVQDDDLVLTEVILDDRSGASISSALAEALTLEAGESKSLDLWVTFRENIETEGFRVGISGEDIGVKQPEGAALEIAIRAENGEFPLWTDLARFSAKSLDQTYANYPNPFQPGQETTTFVFYLPMDGEVSLRLWTTRGEEVVTLVENESRFAGLYQADIWNGKNGRGLMVQNGVYLAELEVRFADGSRKRVLRKVAVIR
ncbi:MAG: DUF11 domain-containing protein, partial [Candidatus Eisenbacteria bacterium]|nr:DUF11 domain-containing protein [Candidatus Eisenbacteria bacterium]